MRSLRRLAALGPEKVAALLQSVLLLPIVALALRRWGYNRVRAALLRVPSLRRGRPVASHPAVVARDTAAMVALAARRGVWPANCLQRSLTLWWLLDRRGIQTDLRFGVRPSEPGTTPAFHAWVELDGRVVNDRPDIATEYLAFGGVPPTVAM